MTFWADRFRRKDEEDIWKELRQQLLNPPSQEELQLKKQQEQAQINATLDRVFPDLEKPTKKTYLNYDELLSPQDAAQYRQKQMLKKEANQNNTLKTGFAAPINQNNQGNLLGKVQQNFSNQTNLVEPNNDVISETQKTSDTITAQLSKIKNIPQNLYNTAKNKVFEYANRDFDRNAPKTLEEKAVQGGIEGLGQILSPMASNATKNGMHDMEAAKQQENVKVYDNLESLEDTKLKDTLKRIGAKDSDKGAVYGIGSRESEAFSNSPELDVYLTKNRANVIAGKPLEDSSLYYDASINDLLPWNNPKKYDRYATARKITLLNPKVDENGIFTCDLVDYSNFDDELVNSGGTYLNKWGYKMQEKGHYKPHYQVIKIRKKVNW